MTTVTRALCRETCASQFSRGRSKPILVILEPPGTLIRLRLKGERRSVAIRVADLYFLACQADVRAKKLARKLEREAKRKAR